MGLPVVSMKQMRHDRSFLRMSGWKAEIVTHGAYPWYVVNDWVALSIAYKDEVTYYLVRKDE